MKPLPETPALLAVAARVVWFKPPAETLADPIHFLAHVMTWGTVEDLRALEGVVGPDSELVELTWVPIEEATHLDMPTITGVVLEVNPVP